MIKISTFLFFLVLSTLSYATGNVTLFETNSFLIKLQENCEEGEVACNNISYSGLRKSDGAKINLNGKTLNRNCETSTCDMYGYKFTNGKYDYTIFVRGTPSLTISLNDKDILSEDGIFSSDISKFDNFDISKAKQNITKSFLGSSLLAKKNIINLINESCDFPTDEGTPEELDSCIISKIAQKYISINEFFEKEDHVHLIAKNGFLFSLMNISNNQNNLLFTVSAQKGKHADGLIVFSQEYSEAGALTQYYYIDNKFENIWLLSVIKDEINRRVNYLKKYHINKTGHIRLDSTISCKYKLVYSERKKTVATCSKN